MNCGVLVIVLDTAATFTEVYSLFVSVLFVTSSNDLRQCTKYIHDHLNVSLG